MTIFYLYTFGGVGDSPIQVRPLGGFSRLIAQTTPTRAEICLLKDLLILLFI